MEIKELIRELEQQGQIQKKNLTYTPTTMKVKKMIIWCNPSPICPRWDAEVWFGDAPKSVRITSITHDTITLLSEMIKRDAIGGK